MDSNILYKTTRVIRDVFDNEDLVITPHLRASDVHGWDSLGNIRLFMELESTFNIHFRTSEIASLKNVGELLQLIEEKLRAAPQPA